MTPGVAIGLAAAQLVGSLGYAVFVGLLLFRVIVLPEPGRRRPLMRLSVAGLGLIGVSALLRLAAVLPDQSGFPLGNAFGVAIVQVGAAVAAACYAPDLVAFSLKGWRRAFGVAVSLLLTASFLLPVFTVGAGSSAITKISTALHVLGFGILIGGMIVVALIVPPVRATPASTLPTLKVLLKRGRVKMPVVFSAIAATGLLTLLIPLTRFSDLQSSVQSLLIVKFVLLLGFLVMASKVHRQIRRAVFRSEHLGEFGDSLLGLRRVVRVEMVIAASALAATSIFAVLAPVL